MNFSQRFADDRALIEEALRAVFQGHIPHADLYDAMNYSLLVGGKRLRPILALECCRLCGGEDRAVLPLACAVEMVHTYSLIHDDLPCMDDDELRRGKPTNHMVYGEATAVLAGDGLLTAAFETVLAAGDHLPAGSVLEAVKVLSAAAGPAGMVGGQVLDMAGEGRSLALSEVEELQRLKTGALIAAAAELGCIAAGGGEERRAAVRRYAEKLGLAFQIRDDILDVTGDQRELGKSVGSDARAEKTTFVTLKGLEECGQMVERLTGEAVEALSGFEDPWFLEELARVLVERTN